MTDKEKIRAEIERRMKFYRDEGTGFAFCDTLKYEETRSILRFIDSLERQPAAEICPRCKYHNKKDGYCYEPHGGIKSRINENGVYDCTGFIEEDKK